MTTTKVRGADTVDRVAQLIHDGQLTEALSLMQGQSSPWIDNARGVCMLRLGRLEEAAKLFAKLTFRAGSVSLTTNAPVVHLTNYATAMMMAGNMDAALTVLNQIPDQQHSAVVKIQAAAAAWRRKLGLLGRIRCAVGLHPSTPATFQDPPGDL